MAAYHFPRQTIGNAVYAANDFDYAPDVILHEGDAIEGKNFSLVGVETSGHATNHRAFALPQESALFSGDLVMVWSTSVIAPPDGAMRPYMASLEKLVARDDKIYWPGHGGPIKEPQRFVRALLQHRRVRETAILSRIEAGDSTIPAIVANVYDGLDPALANASAAPVRAHIEDLVEQALVRTERSVALGAPIDRHRA